MVAAPLCLFEGLATAIVSGIEATEANPYFREVQADYVLDHRVAAIDGDGETALEIATRLFEVPDLGVKDSQVVEHPGHWFGVARHLKGAETVGVEGSRLSEIAAHARQDATILLDHSEQSGVAGFRREG